MKIGNELVWRILLWISLALFVALYIFDPTKGIGDEQNRQLVRMAILRISAIPAIVSCIAILRLRLCARPRGKNFAFFLPAMLVALNNSPWLPLADGSAVWKGNAAIGLLAIQVVGVGIMEELAFRGVLLPLLLERFGRTKKGMWVSVLLSSAVFGLIHFANLIEMPNLAAVLMQVGYSTLLGALCAALLLGTGNIWYCVAVHTVYNFGGGLNTYFVEGTVWDLPTVLCTVFLAVAVFCWYLYLMLKQKPEDLPVFRKKKEEKDGGENA